MNKCVVWAVTLVVAFCAAAYAGPVEDYNKGLDYYDKKGDVASAIKFLKKSSDAGYAPAQALLGYIYDQSEQDKEAVEAYKKAAAQGNAAGLFGLGGMYAKGEGVKADMEKALDFITRAAEKDCLLAVDVLCSTYRKGGLGVAADPEKFAYWKNKKKALEKAKADKEKAEREKAQKATERKEGK